MADMKNLSTNNISKLLLVHGAMPKMICATTQLLFNISSSRTYQFHLFVWNSHKFCYFMCSCFLHMDVMHLRHDACISMMKYFQSYFFRIFHLIYTCFKRMTFECKKYELTKERFSHNFHLKIVEWEVCDYSSSLFSTYVMSHF
jgi:hypothetical protein